MPIPFRKVMERFSPEEQAEIAAEAARIKFANRRLVEVRKLVGLTQTDVAKALRTSQANVARIESGQDSKLSTLSRVVKALGGELELLVHIPGHETVALRIGRGGDDSLQLRKGRKPPAKRRPKAAIATGGISERKAPVRRRA